MDQNLPGCSVNRVSLWEGGSPGIRPRNDVAFSGSAIELIMYKRVPAVQTVEKRDLESGFGIRFQGEHFYSASSF